MLHRRLSGWASWGPGLLVLLSGLSLIGWQAKRFHAEFTAIPRAPERVGAAVEGVPALDAGALERLFGPAQPAYADTGGLLIRGSVVAADPRDSFAMVEIPGQGVRSVHAGDEVLPGTRVRDIERERVRLVGAGGALIEIALPSSASASMSAAGQIEAFP